MKNIKNNNDKRGEAEKKGFPGLQERHSELWFKLKIILVSSNQNKTQDITAILERTIQGFRAIHVQYTPSNLSIPTINP